MQLISRQTAERFLGTRSVPFFRRYGRRPGYASALVLGFAGELRRAGEWGYISLPWQVAKQWALAAGEAPPRGEQPDSYGARTAFRFPWSKLAEVADLYAFPAPMEVEA